MYKTVGLLFIGIFLTVVLRAQDTLPRFSVAARGPGKILISWHSNYTAVSQISIQRSIDSLKDFTTLITVPDPSLPANGATDSKAPHPNFYYRLFVVLDNGKYFFTPSQRPRSNTAETPIVVAADNADQSIAKAADTRVLFLSPADNRTHTSIHSPRTIHSSPGLSAESTVYVRKGDILRQLASSAVQSFRDSILRHTKDTLVFIDGDTLLIKPFIAPEVYRTSAYVYTGKYGNVHIALPEAARRHYSIKFFDDNNQLLFELSEIRDPALIVDKTNFHHAGWFHFELYEGGQLKEKNKLFIPKEF